MVSLASSCLSFYKRSIRPRPWTSCSLTLSHIPTSSLSSWELNGCGELQAACNLPSPDRSCKASCLGYGAYPVIRLDVQIQCAILHDAALGDIGPVCIYHITADGATHDVGPVRGVGVTLTIPPDSRSELANIIFAAVVAIPYTGQIYLSRRWSGAPSAWGCAFNTRVTTRVVYRVFCKFLALFPHPFTPLS